MVFPSMGIMFALGGSLMVQSLRRGEALDVIGHRLRRLLPPLWLFGLIAVPIMLWHGWAGADVAAVDDTVTSPLSWADLFYWVLPLLDPPGSDWGSNAVVGLWYIRAYLWFVLLTPLMLWAYRRRPLVALAVPLAVVAADAVLGSPLGDWDGSAGPAVLDAATFGACWMLGFAHREGTLRRLPGLLTGSLAVVLVAGGLAWAFSHPAGDIGVDLNDIPLAQALVSLGAVLVFLRVSPRVAWLERVPLLGRLVTVINARAITIYLWHNVAIELAGPVGELIGWDTEVRRFGIALVLLVVGVLAFGWVEDLAAGRSLSLVPDGRGTQRARGARRAPQGPRPPVIPLDVESGITSALSQGSLRTRLTRLAQLAVPAQGARPTSAPRPSTPPASHPGAMPHPTRRPEPVGARGGRYTTAGGARSFSPIPAPPPPLPSPTPTARRPVPVGAGGGPGRRGRHEDAVAPDPVPARPRGDERPLLSFTTDRAAPARPTTASPSPPGHGEARPRPGTERSRHSLDEDVRDAPAALPERSRPSRHSRTPPDGA
jgi:hypothetical protein